MIAARVVTVLYGYAAKMAQPPDFTPGAIVWIPNPYPEGDGAYRLDWLPASVSPRPLWAPAAIVGSVVGEPSLLRVSALLKPRLPVTVRFRELLPMGDPSVLQDLQDAPVAHLNAPSLSFSMAARALQGRFVTRAAPNLWLSVNPCRVAVDGAGVSLLDPLYMARTFAMPPRETRLRGGAAAADAPPPPAPPHVFDAAEAALGALGAARGATLVFSGEAGGGKSEALKSALSYLLAMPALDAAGISRGCLASPAAVEPDARATRRELLLGGGGGAGPSAGYALLLGAPDVALAQRDAAKRRGPLGTVRNPWFTAGTFSVGGGGGATGGVAGWGVDAYRLLASGAPQLARVALAAHTVLEAFGCAAVGTGGANSSRFVSATRLLYAPAAAARRGARGARGDGGGEEEGGGGGGAPRGARYAGLLGGRPLSLRGAVIDAALWEPRRAAGGGALLTGGGPQPGRNFHAFYQLLGGAPRELRAELRLGAPEDYALLHERSWGDASWAGGPPALRAVSAAAEAGGDGVADPAGALLGARCFAHGAPVPKRGASATHSVATASSAYASVLWDAEEFAHTQKALAAIQLPLGTRGEVWRLLSALLMAGNVAFASQGGDAGAGVATPREAAEMAALLGVEAGALARALTSESVAVKPAGGGAAAVVARALTTDAARARLAALVTSLYAALFAWLLRAANEALRDAARNDDLGGGGGGAPEPEFALTLLDGTGLEGALPRGVSASLFSGSHGSGSGCGVELDVDTAAHAGLLLAHALADFTASAWVAATFHGEADLFSAEGVAVSLAVLAPASEAAAAHNAAELILGDVSLLTELEDAPARGSLADGGGVEDGALVNSVLARLAAYFERNERFVGAPALLRAGAAFSRSCGGAAPEAPAPAPPPVFMVRHAGGDVLYSAAGVTVERDGSSALTGRGGAALAALLGGGSTVALVRALVHAAAGGTEAGLAADDLSSGLALGAPAPREAHAPPPLSLASALTRARRVVVEGGLRAPGLPEDGSGLFWVRCMRPNAALAPGVVDVEALARGAEAAHALDAAAAASASFAAHMPYAGFYARYHALLGPAASARLPFPPPSDAAAHRPLCSELLRVLGSVHATLGALLAPSGAERAAASGRGAAAAPGAGAKPQQHLVWGRRRLFLRRPLCVFFSVPF